MPGPPELILILLIVVVVFGAGRIPQIGDALGKGIRNFKRAISGKDEIDITPDTPKGIDAGSGEAVVAEAETGTETTSGDGGDAPAAS